MYGKLQVINPSDAPSKFCWELYWKLVLSTICHQWIRIVVLEHHLAWKGINACTNHTAWPVFLKYIRSHFDCFILTCISDRDTQLSEAISDNKRSFRQSKRLGDNVNKFTYSEHIKVSQTTSCPDHDVLSHQRFFRKQYVGMSLKLPAVTWLHVQYVSQLTSTPVWLYKKDAAVPGI